MINAEISKSKDPLGYFDYGIRFRIHESELPYLDMFLDQALNDLKKSMMLLKVGRNPDESKAEIDPFGSKYDNSRPYPDLPDLVEVMNKGRKVAFRHEPEVDKEVDSSISQLEI